VGVLLKYLVEVTDICNQSVSKEVVLNGTMGSSPSVEGLKSQTFSFPKKRNSAPDNTPH
jgi:hypothetical protein